MQALKQLGRPAGCTAQSARHGAACVAWTSSQHRSRAAAPPAPAAAAAADAPAAPSRPAAAATRNPPATRGVACRAAAAQAPASTKLAQQEIKAIVNAQGGIQPDIEAGTAAWVYAIFDEKQKLQYIGFSNDLRNSLRTVFSRRTDKAYFYKALPLPEMNQEQMLAIREEWFAEVGGAPPGNKLALERAQWQQPVDAGAISQRGKQGAAEEKSRQLVEAIKARGCKEDFVPNPTLMADGMVDFLPAREVSAEELETQRAAAAELAKQRRTCKVMVDGSPKEFQVLFQRTIPTNGGVMVDLTCTFDGKETTHRIIVGKPYYEPFGLPAETPVTVALALLLATKQSLAPGDGMLGSATFPSKYFAVSEMEQWYGEEFMDLFGKMTGHTWDGDTSRFWRFNKVHDYGAMKLETTESLKVAVGRYD